MAVLEERGPFFIYPPGAVTCLSRLTKPATLLFDLDGSVRNATARRQRLEFTIEKVKLRKSNKLTISTYLKHLKEALIQVLHAGLVQMSTNDATFEMQVTKSRINV